MTSAKLNRQLQESLYQSEERFRLLVESVQDYAIFMLNPDGYIASWNIGAERIKGYQAEEIIGQHFSCFYPLEDIERGKPEQELKIAQNCGRVEDEGWRLRKDGSPFWANVIITALRDNYGNLQGFAKVTRDMTERKMAEELRTSHFLVNAVLEGITDAVFVKDIQSQYLLINSAGANFIGKPVAEIIGKDDRELFALDSAEKIITDDRQILRSGASLTYEETVTADNITRTYLTTKTPYRDESGNTLGLLGISRDISDRKIFESQLKTRSRQQEAIAHLGQLALSGIHLSTLFDETATRIAEVLGNEYCKILELLPDGDALLLRAGVGWQAELVGRAKVGTELQSQAGYTLLSNQPVIVDDLRTETRFHGPSLLHNHGVISGMSVIIAGQNRPWGVLGTHTTQQRKFTQDDVNFFQAAANILAQAIARKQMEAALQETNQMLDSLIANSPLAIACFDLQRRVKIWNPAAEQMFGWSRAEVSGKPFPIVPPEKTQEFAAIFQDVLQGQRFTNFETYRYKKDGSTIEVSISIAPLQNAVSEITGMMGIISEISERKRAEAEKSEILAREQAARKQADESLALLDTLLDSAPVGLAFFDRGLRCLRMNEYLAAINGVSLEQTIGRTMQEYLPEFADQVEALMCQVLETGEPIKNLEITGETKAGDRGEQHALASYYPVYAKDGKIRGIGIAVSDITHLKRTEKTLRERTAALLKQQEWLEDVLNFMPTPLLFIEPETGKVTFANRAADQLAGGEFPKDKPAEEYHTIYYCTDAAGNRIADEQMPGVRVARGERLDGFEMSWHTPRGIRPLIVFGDTLPAMHGHPATGVVVFHDVSQLKKTEKELFERTQRLQLLSETTSELLSSEQPLFLINNLFTKLQPLELDLYFNYLVDEEKQMLHLASWGGISEELAQQIEWLEFNQGVCGTVASQGCQLSIANIQQGTDPKTQFLRSIGIQTFACQPLRVEGRIKGTLAFGSRSRSSLTAEEIAWLQTICDQIAIALHRSELITSLQRQTEQLQQASRMKDEFLAIVSHELRSPLNAILGWATILQRNSINDATKSKALETIERNARLQTQLIEDLLDVSRIITGKLKLNMQSLQIAAIVQAAVESIRLVADAKQIQLECLSDPTVGTVKGDFGRLQQVIWNLLSNAIKFTPTGGQVQVRLYRVNSHVEITVSDTGIGIEPEFLPFVFERFRQADATTTRAYGGLGLGLAIVRHLVELHGGSVCVESPGKEQGTTFTVKLPSEMPVLLSTRVPDGGISLNSSDSLASLPSLAGLKVLIVDDEADTRDYQATVLLDHGAIIKTAASAAEALEVIRQWQPDVLLSDIGMPFEDGYSLIRKIRALSPADGGQIPAAALTAYTKDEERQQALSAGFQQHLSKPVEPFQLVKVVATLAKKN